MQYSEKELREQHSKMAEQYKTEKRKDFLSKMIAAFICTLFVAIIMCLVILVVVLFHFSPLWVSIPLFLILIFIYLMLE